MSERAFLLKLGYGSRTEGKLGLALLGRIRLKWIRKIKEINISSIQRATGLLRVLACALELLVEAREVNRETALSAHDLDQIQWET